MQILGQECHGSQNLNIETRKHYPLMVVANDCEGRWCVFCIQINIIDDLNLPYQLWNQAPIGGD
jgi:hypothetical protein